jgi:hypothetical protein
MSEGRILFPEHELSMDPAIIIVSGLPRSGTSLMMQMLDKGGVEVVTDQVRTPDIDNPRGYYEFEKAKKIKEDTSWLPQMRGKAFKMVSLLLYDLLPTEQYRIIFMERNLDEILDSQEKMLKRLGRKATPRESMKQSFSLHLQRLHAWLQQQRNVQILNVNYRDVIEQPEQQADRVNHFIGGRCNTQAMVRSVDPSLYRNRTGST